MYSTYLSTYMYLNVTFVLCPKAVTSCLNACMAGMTHTGPERQVSRHIRRLICQNGSMAPKSNHTPLLSLGLGEWESGGNDAPGTSGVRYFVLIGCCYFWTIILHLILEEFMTMCRPTFVQHMWIRLPFLPRVKHLM